jgi:O-antigen/teichoic acid export membrane protein/glycosyltransferase involved in cell wall biosynthesis
MKTKINHHWPLTLFSSLSALTSIALPLVLVRLLTPEEMGQYKLIFLYIALLPWFALTGGVNNGLYFWVGQEKFRDYFYSSWSLLLTWAAILALGVFAYFGGRGFAPWYAMAVLFSLLSNFHEESLVATGHTWRGAIFSSSFEIVRIVLVLCAALLTRQVEWIVKAYVLVTGAKLMVGMILGRMLNLQRLALPLDKYKPDLTSVLKYVVPVSLASLMAVFTHYADQLMLSKVVAASYFASYTLCCLTVPPLNSMEQAVNRVLIPSLHRDTPKFFKDAFSELAWIMIPATVGLVLFARPIVILLFTEKYAGSSIFLQGYAFTYLLLAFPYDAWARARGDAKWIFKNLLMALTVTIIFVPVLTYRFHGIGALAGLLLTQLSLRVGGWFDLRKTTEWKISEFTPVADLTFYASVSFILGTGCFFAKQWISSELTWLFIFAPAFFILYLAVTLRRRLWRHFREREIPGVLQMTQYLESGGLERIIYSLCYSFQKSKKMEASVFFYDERVDAKSLVTDFEALGVPVVHDGKSAGFSLGTVFRLLRHCYQNRIGILHTHDLGPLLYASIAKIISLGTLKIVHTQHSFVHFGGRKRNKLYERIFTHFANRIVVVSEDARAMYLQLGVPAKKLNLLVNGVFFPETIVSGADKKMLRSRLSGEILESRDREKLILGLEKNWFLYLARIHAQKGQDSALRIWKALPTTTREQSVLVFVGQESTPGEVAKLKSYAEENEVESSVVFAGVTKDSMAWLQASDLLLSLSEYEGMPLSPIEARGAGLPLILSRIPGHDWMKAEALLVDLPVGDGKPGAAIFLEALATVGASSREEKFRESKVWRESYGLQRMADQYLNLYRMYLGGDEA